MKKLLSLILVVLMCLSGFAFAENSDQLILEYPEYGFTMRLPDDFNRLKGIIQPAGPVKLYDGMDVYAFLLSYIAVSQEEIADAAGEDGGEIPEGLIIPYITVFIVKNSLEGSMVNAFPGNAQDVGGGMGLLGQTDDFGYYYVDFGDSRCPEESEFAAEYTALRGRTDEVLSMFEVYPPYNPYAAKIDTKLSFRTTDLDGNAIDSAELFGRHEYTLLNIWASWCGPCKAELAELDALNQRLADLDCGVVGLLLDKTEEGKPEKAKAIMAGEGANYLCILAPEGFEDILRVQSFPTSYFIDRNGTVVGNPIVGARPDEYEPHIRELLERKTAEIQEAVEDKPSYAVTVLDQNGDPVPGASVGFCLDTGCVPVESDENGVATYNGAPNRYHIQVVDAPDGYDYPDDTDAYIGPESGEATLTITKK